MKYRLLTAALILLPSAATTAFAASNFESSKFSSGVVVQGTGFQSSKLSTGVVVQGVAFQSAKISVGIVLQSVPAVGGIIPRTPLTHW
jgi:hypothetical protein